MGACLVSPAGRVHERPRYDVRVLETGLGEPPLGCFSIDQGGYVGDFPPSSDFSSAWWVRVAVAPDLEMVVGVFGTPAPPLAVGATIGLTYRFSRPEEGGTDTLTLFLVDEQEHTIAFATQSFDLEHLALPADLSATLGLRLCESLEECGSWARVGLGVESGGEFADLRSESSAVVGPYSVLVGHSQLELSSSCPSYSRGRVSLAGTRIGQ